MYVHRKSLIFFFELLFELTTALKYLIIIFSPTLI